MASAIISDPAVVSNNAYSPAPFAFESHQIRTVINGDGNPWFVAKDAAVALGLTWTGHTLDAIPKDWVGVVKLTTPKIGVNPCDARAGAGGGDDGTHHPKGKGGWRPNTKITVISEPAVYKLAFRSNKPEADRFTNWIASEVIPALRRTGKYEVCPTVSLAPTRLTTAKERNALTGLVNRYVGMLPGGPNPEAYKAAYAKIHDVMGVKSVEELTVEQLPRAVGFMQSLLDMVGKIAVPALPETPEILPATMESQIQRLRSLKREMLDLGTDVYRAVKRNLRPRACDHGKPTGSLVVNMNYMLDDVFYALDRNLDAIEHLCVAGELARRVFPESHHTR